MRRVLHAVTAFLAVCFLATPSAFAKGLREGGEGPDARGTTEATHTITWWCVDLNELWHVGVPVIIGAVSAIPPDPSPIPDPCVSPFPVQVPNGSAFAPGATIWATNKTYPPAVRSALEASGYNFHSQSPAEDFMSKFVEIRVEVRDFADPTNLVAVFSFDPQQSFRLVRTGDWFGQLAIDPFFDPALGIDITAEEAGRLPMFGFPVIAGPVPPGNYRAWIYWALSDLHNDGLGLEDGNFLPAGDFLYAFPRFIVLP